MEKKKLGDLLKEELKCIFSRVEIELVLTEDIDKVLIKIIDKT